MKLPFNYRLFGYYRISTAEENATRLHNLLFVYHIAAIQATDGSFFLPRKERKRLLEASKKERIPLRVSAILGMPAYLWGRRYRIGLPLGALLAAWLLWLGTHTVWRVQVMGVETLSCESVEENLAALGFGVGTSTEGVDYEALSTAYRLAHPEVAWMGIYTQGTTAYVKVMENKAVTEAEKENAFSHLIAKEDAVVVKTDILHGSTCVQIGSVVKKGDILVLGMLKGAHGDRLLAAEGTVTGRVSKTFSVTVPKTESVKTEKSREKIAIDIIFFEKVINIFKKDTTNASDYVIIDRKEQLFLPNGLPLPIEISYRELLTYTQEERPLDAGEGMRIATEELERMIRVDVENGTLLSRRVWTETKDGVCVLYATVEYTKNIAERLPISSVSR